MKKILTYILTLIAFSTALVSCADDYFNDSQAADGKVSLRLILSFPSSESQTRTTDRPESMESATDSLHVLIFENGRLQEEVKNITITSSNASNGTKTLNAITEKSYKNQIEVAILTNVGKERGEFNGSQYLGASKASIYKSLTYKYPSAWDITKQAIPMWGAISLTPKNPNNVSIGLYRALAKMNVYDKQAEGDKKFTLTSVRVYYSYDEGYSTPLVEPTASNPVLLPSIIEGSNRFDVNKPLVYTNAEGTTAFENLIYVPEANNELRTKDEKALCLVVGGKYTGAGLVGSNEDSYYRIDLKDKEKTPYDVLRNHVYNFNINSVNSPGTSTPEEALENAVVGMDVTIEEWDETALSGITNQYTLTTDKSRVVFGIVVDKDEEVNITSDYGEDWTIVDIEGTWFECEKRGDKVILHTKTNYGASREGSFCIKSGNLKKQIFVEQLQPGTANSYLVGKGEHEISVILKGNGTPGLHAEDKGGAQVELDNSAVLDPAYLSIIWETHPGLVKLIKQDNSEVIDHADYNKETGRLRYKVYPEGAQIGEVNGGNALIGAFNEKGEVIWSWHIWVSPDMMLTGYQDENWTLTGYKVMDRNLGAISNKPGVASLGLLYQWGRKDPMIGAKEISKTSGRLDTQNYLNHEWVADVKGANNGIDFTIKNPTKLIHGGLAVNDTKMGPYLWGTNGGLNTEGVKELGKKTIYDPCPVGYRVPPVDAFVFKKEVTYEAKWGRPLPSDNFATVEGLIWEKGKAMNTRHNVWVSWNETDHSDREFRTEIFLNMADFAKTPYWIETKATLAYTVNKTSEKHNWNENVLYIPHATKTEKEFAAIGNAEKPGDYLYNYEGSYIAGQQHYGFYVNYKNIQEPLYDKDSYTDYTFPGTSVKYKVYNQLDKTDPERKSISWLPISGAYEPEKGFTFNGVVIETGSTLTVNSFIWTNSSVLKTSGGVEPAAMFLHGTEDGGQQTSGRHIHGLTKADINARPDYAGAVRCVRDEKKVFVNDNKVPESIPLEVSKGSAMESSITSINDTWRVLDPGAHWFKITPDQGYPDKNKGTAIMLTVTETNTTGTERTAIVKVKFALEDTPRYITVTQKSE